MFKTRTPLVAILIVIVIIVVTSSIAKSASALTPEQITQNQAEQGALIVALIRLHAPSEAVARTVTAIAACESTGFRHTHNNGSLIRNRSGSGAFGVLQIMPAHVRIARERHGLRIRENLHDYIQYALQLYRNNRARGGDGFADWNASRPCWSRPGRLQQELQALGHEATQFIEVAEARP